MGETGNAAKKGDQGFPFWIHTPPGSVSNLEVNRDPGPVNEDGPHFDWINQVESWDCAGQSVICPDRWLGGDSVSICPE